MDFQNTFEDLNKPINVQLAPVEFENVHQEDEQNSAAVRGFDSYIPQRMLFEAEELLKLEAAIREEEREQEKIRKLQEQRKTQLQQRRTISFYPGQLDQGMRTQLNQAKKLYDHIHQREQEKLKSYSYFHPKTLSGHYFDVAARSKVKKDQKRTKSKEKVKKPKSRNQSVDIKRVPISTTTEKKSTRIIQTRDENKENEEKRLSSDQREHIKGVVRSQKSQERIKSASKSHLGSSRKSLPFSSHKSNSILDKKPMSALEFEKRIEKIIHQEILQLEKNSHNQAIQDYRDHQEISKISPRVNSSFQTAVRIYSANNLSSLPKPQRSRTASPNRKSLSPQHKTIASPHQVDLMQAQEYPTRENGEQNVNDIREYDQKIHTMQKGKTQAKSFYKAPSNEETLKRFHTPKAKGKETDLPKSILKNARPQTAMAKSLTGKKSEAPKQIAHSIKETKQTEQKEPAKTEVVKKSKVPSSFGPSTRDKTFTPAKMNSRGYVRYIKQKVTGFVEILVEDLIFEIVHILNDEDKRNRNHEISIEKQAIINRCLEELKEINLQQTLLDNRREEIAQAALEEGRKIEELANDNTELLKTSKKSQTLMKPSKKSDLGLDGTRHLTLTYEFIDEKKKYSEGYNAVKTKDKLLSDKTLIKMDYVVDDMLDDLLLQAAEELCNTQDELVETVFKSEFDL